MKAVLIFDTEQEQDVEDFHLVMQASDYKEAFQSTFKFVKDRLDNYPSGNLRDVKEQIIKIAEECNVEVW